MRQILLIGVLGAALGLTGCSELVSLNSIAAEGASLQDPALPGVWAGSDEMFIVRQDGSGYRIVYVDKDSSRKFRAVLFQAGEAKLLDLVPEEEDPFRVPVHIVVRVWTEPSTLRWTFLDTDWLKQQARKALVSQDSADRTLLTAPGAAVRGFLNTFGADERAYKEANTLSRVQ